MEGISNRIHNEDDNEFAKDFVHFAVQEGKQSHVLGAFNEKYMSKEG